MAATAGEAAVAPDSENVTSPAAVSMGAPTVAKPVAPTSDVPIGVANLAARPPIVSGVTDTVVPVPASKFVTVACSCIIAGSTVTTWDAFAMPCTVATSISAPTAVPVTVT